MLAFQHLFLRLLFLLGSGPGSSENPHSKSRKPNLASPSKCVGAPSKITSKSIASLGPLDDGAFIYSLRLFLVAYYKQFLYLTAGIVSLTCQIVSTRWAVTTTFLGFMVLFPKMLSFWLASQLEVIPVLLVDSVFLITSCGLLSFVQQMRKYIQIF